MSDLNQPAPLSRSSIERELLSYWDRSQSLAIFDIGSCNGLDSVRYAQLFPNARVFAFEPIPANFSNVARNLSHYQVSNVSAFQIALSNKNGTVQMHVSAVTTNGEERVSDSSSILAPAEHEALFPNVKFLKPIEVETRRLDDFCKSEEIDAIDLIHMDVQGAEMLVLEGAGRMLQSTKLIWLEVSDRELYQSQPRRKHIERFMEKAGFALIKFEIAQHFGNQLYVRKAFVREKSGNTGVGKAEFKNQILKSRTYFLASSYLRKAKYLLKF